MKIEFPATITINAPAERVWHIVAHEFANIGTWATAIPNSSGLADLPVPENAHVGGRACQAAIPGFSTVHERFTYYDEANMRFGYAAIAGLPGFMQRAENNWSVRALTPEQSEVQIRGEMELYDPWGWFLGPLLQMQMGRTGKRTIEELKYYIETGQPHPRKVRSVKSGK